MLKELTIQQRSNVVTDTVTQVYIKGAEKGVTASHPNFHQGSKKNDIHLSNLKSSVSVYNYS